MVRQQTVVDMAVAVPVARPWGEVLTRVTLIEIDKAKHLPGCSLAV